MGHVVFTYGSLLSERVLHAVLGRVPERMSAKIYGYCRRPIRDRCYPAVVCGSSSDIVKGKILIGIAAAELVLLDAFEDAAYDRVTVTVEKEDGGTIQARLWARPQNNTSDLVVDKDWDENRFRNEDEDWYVQQCKEWVAAYNASSENKFPED